MATAEEFTQLAGWLESQGFTVPAHRETTLSYLQTVLGDSSPQELRRLCLTLREQAQDHEARNPGQKFSVTWRSLKRMARG